MSFVAALNRIDKRYAWSLLGFVLAVAFGGLSLYTEFVRDRRPRLRFEIISDASVLDVREKLGNLEIIYDGVDIQKAQRSLRVVVVRVANEGPDDILKGHFDEKTPLGFRVLKGTLLRTELLSSSNTYLRQALRINMQAPNTASFDPIILEANEWFTVKSLILHADGSHPQIESIGKVAGVRQIRRVDSTEVAAAPSFFAQTFSGGPGVQVTRTVTYFFGFIALVAGVITPIVIVSGGLASRRRRRHVSQFKSISKLDLMDRDEFIFERYVENDIDYLHLLQRAQNEERLEAEIRRRRKQKESRPDPHVIEPVLLMHPSDSVPARLRRRLPIVDMQKSGFIVEADGHWRVDPHLRQTLDDFIRFLEIKRAT